MNKTTKKIIVIGLIIVSVIVGFNYERIFLIPKYRKPIIDNVIDPTSVIFKNEEFHDGLLCGEFNSKNRMGAYTGFEKFIAHPYEAFINENILRSDRRQTSYLSRFVKWSQQYYLLGESEELERINYALELTRALEKNKQTYNEYESLEKKYYAISATDYLSADEYQIAKASYKQKMFIIMWDNICED